MSKHRYAQVYAGIHTYTQVNTGVHKYTQAYTRMHMYTQVYTSIYIHRYKEVYTVVSHCVGGSKVSHAHVYYKPQLSRVYLDKPHAMQVQKFTRYKYSIKSSILYKLVNLFTILIIDEGKDEGVFTTFVTKLPCGQILTVPPIDAKNKL